MNKLAFYPLLGLLFFLSSCQSEKKTKIDAILYNATIYTADKDFSQASAIAINADTIVEVGSKELLKKYKATDRIDVRGNVVLPGLIDAHAHFYGLGLQQNRVDLTGTKSMKEVLMRLNNFRLNRTDVQFFVGRGWDQNLWEDKEFPNRRLLDQAFPFKPVILTRVDGHALLANKVALEMAGIDENTEISGGEILKDERGNLTGVLIDNAMDFAYDIIPDPDVEQKVEALKKAEKHTTSRGLTSIVDAGLDKSIIDIIDSLQQRGELKTRLYTMMSNTPENIDYYIENGIYKTKRLNVRSVKVYADGALGSRGAALKEPYNDRENHFGSMLIDLDEFRALSEKLADSDLQMNTHAIGDSANYVVLNQYNKVLEGQSDRRWRVEHAQILDGPDFDYFDGENILASVQPTHATSDMYWAEERLGEKRIKNSYAYKKLLDQSGTIALGTDFPIEKVNPILTFYAAVSRQDVESFPEDGFQAQNALSREEALRGMTIWAAYANFEENEKGSLEPGKFADMTIIDRDIMEVPVSEIPETKVLRTYIGGERIFPKELKSE
ncbi:MAG: amidohydrolase [Psychroflexus sp.]|nr:amidohydrolase [Psychroflexus sp.]MDN6310705.1 amidohydrolase [Psychroflexus sp.]